MPDLVVMFLLISCVSLVFQVLAFIRLAALVVFGAIQALWQLNSLLDIRIRRSLGQQGEPRDS